MPRSLGASPASASRQTHEVALIAAAAQPLVGKRVPELVGVEVVAQPGRPPALLDHLADPRVCQSAAATEPEGREVCRAAR